MAAASLPLSAIVERDRAEVAAWLEIDPDALEGLDGGTLEKLLRSRQELVDAHAMLLLYADVTAVARERIAELTASSAVDPLTGMLNRRSIERQLATELERSRRTGDPLSVVLIDVDGLKQVNDTQGHMAGDELLRRVSVAVCAVLRAGDEVGRIGGDEFIVVLPRADAGQAEQIADRIRRCVHDLPAPSSAGWARAPSVCRRGGRRRPRPRLRRSR